MDNFHQILTNLLSTDNNVRKTAQGTYQSLPLESKVLYLFNAVQNQGGNVDERQVAAVMLRRLIANDFVQFFSNLSPENQKQFKDNLLLCVNNERNGILRRRLCDIASEVARNQLDDDGNNSWPEFLNFLFQCVNSPSNDIKDSALQMFINVPGVFGNEQSNYLVVIKQILHQSLSIPDLNVQIQAVKAICAFILFHENVLEIQKQFTDLLPSMMGVINSTLSSESTDSLIKLLIDLAGRTPRFLRSQVTNIIDMCLKYIKNDEGNESYQKLCLEFVVTLAETAPAMVCKESSKYIIHLVVHLLELMATVEDEDDWDTQDDPNVTNYDHESMSVIAQSALDRLACGLGGKTMLPYILNYVSSMLANPNWKYRQAAFMALSAVGEGCHKQMKPMLQEILDGILNFLQDPHPRVRYAMCNVICLMARDFAPNFQKKYHDKIVPAILLLLEDNLNPRVQAHAGVALDIFLKECPKRILLSYMDQMMIKLKNILQACVADLVEGGGKRRVLQQMVTTIASIAVTCEENFVKFYDHLMPCLREIITSADAPELKMLRGKTIECVSLIGLAVGKEKFLVDASDIMCLTLVTHDADDDSQTSYLKSWARMCKVMGQHFKEYLPFVIDPVMAAASLKPEMELFHIDDMDSMSDSNDWQFLPLDRQEVLGIKTSGLEDKASACDTLVCYARELKTGFAPYVEDVLKLMVPSLKFHFHNNVQIAAAQSMPCLLECAETRGSEYLQNMWTYICPELLKAIKSETESNVAAEMHEALGKCIELLGAGCLSDKWMKDILAILEKSLNTYFENELQRFERREDEDDLHDHDDEVVEEELAMESGAEWKILHALFVTYKTDFFQYFDLIVHHFAKLLESDRSSSDHEWGLCVFHDVIEYCGPDCAKYQAYFLGPMVGYVTDYDSNVRLAAIYGCGLLGMCGGPSFADVCSEVIPFLLQVINSADARNVDNISTTEYAVSAIAKILDFNSSSVNVDEILPLWLCNLPVSENTDEAPFVYGYLCKLIENHHPVVCGANNSNIPSLIRIIAEAFLRDAIDRSHDVAQRMILIVRQIQTNPEVFNACLAVLNQEQIKTLQSLMMTNN